MPVTDTPLRYPGGKSQLVPFVVEILRENNLFYGEYAEAFAGGAGIAMTLLLNGYVDRVYINDIDPAIHAFWSSVLHRTDELCSLIEETTVTMDEWYAQRKIHFEGNAKQELKLGFSTLFLNRTNRSGILKGGVIGGLSQNGKYKIDCRFNRADLIRKVRRIARYRSQIGLSQLDAADFVRSVVPRTEQRTLVNLDPPYFGMGPELYTNFYNLEDHTKLARAVASIDRHWMVTYDDAPEIRQLYARYPMFLYGLNYSVQLKRIGTELMILNAGLAVPPTVKTALTDISYKKSENA
jgi:DNA adenine methylase